MTSLHTDTDPANRDAATQLKDSAWAVQIGRGMIDDYCNSDEFGSLLALAAVMAWRDRGPGWFKDGKRDAAERPPGGWARMIGVTRPTWIAWCGMASDLGLISESQGPYESGATVPLLCPVEAVQMREHETEAYEVPDEQFARIPCAALFNPKLSRTAKRVLVGLALYRKPSGFARVAVPTIAKRAGLNDRNTQLGLRELERAGVIKSNGLYDRVRTYQIFEQRPDKRKVSDTPRKARDTPPLSERHPKRKARDTPSVKPETPYQESSRVLSGETNQENLSRAERLSVVGPTPFRRDHAQKEMPLMRVVEGSKDAHQQEAPDIDASASEPTPAERRNQIASLDAAIATAIGPWYRERFERLRDNHVAALDGDTGARATA